MLSVTEETVIRNVIAKLKGQSKTSPDVHAALTTGTTKCFLDIWVVGALGCLLPEGRDPQLALDLSDYSPRDDAPSRMRKYDVAAARTIAKATGWTFQGLRGRWFIWKDRTPSHGSVYRVTDKDGFALSHGVPAVKTRFHSIAEAQAEVDKIIEQEK